MKNKKKSLVKKVLTSVVALGGAALGVVLAFLSWQEREKKRKEKLTIPASTAIGIILIVSMGFAFAFYTQSREDAFQLERDPTSVNSSFRAAPNSTSYHKDDDVLLGFYDQKEEGQERLKEKGGEDNILNYFKASTTTNSNSSSLKEYSLEQDFPAAFSDLKEQVKICLAGKEEENLSGEIVLIKNPEMNDNIKKNNGFAIFMNEFSSIFNPAIKQGYISMTTEGNDNNTFIITTTPSNTDLWDCYFKHSAFFGSKDYFKEIKVKRMVSAAQESNKFYGAAEEEGEYGEDKGEGEGEGEELEKKKEKEEIEKIEEREEKKYQSSYQNQINFSYQNQTEVKIQKDIVNFISKDKQEKLTFTEPTGAPNLPSKIFKFLLPVNINVDSIKINIDNIETNEINELEIKPVLPAVIRIPLNKQGEKIKIEEINEKTIWKEVKYWPKGEESYDKKGRDKEIYENNTLYPLNILENKKFSLGEIRGYKILEVPINLFQYHPINKNLIKIESFDLNISFNLISSQQSIHKAKVDQLGKNRVIDIVENFEQFSSYYYLKKGKTTDKNSYVIITTEDIKNNSTQLNNFIIQKNKIFNTRIVTMKEIRIDLGQCILEEECAQLKGDPAAENIRSWLQQDDRYLNLKIEYVLLIGDPHPDEGTVPMKTLWPKGNDESWGNFPSDFYYADMNGNWNIDGDEFYGEGAMLIFNGIEYVLDHGDTIAGGIDLKYEFIVGRMPYYNEIKDLDNILEKTINYENSTDTTWRNNILLPMMTFTENNPGYNAGEIIKNDLDNYINKYHRIYEYDYNLNPKAETILDGLDHQMGVNLNDDHIFSVNKTIEILSKEKFGVITWNTHGVKDRAFNVMDVDNLENLNNQYPAFIFQGSCLNAYPEDNNNLSYALLKTKAINTIGATRISWGHDAFQTSLDNRFVQGFSYLYTVNLMKNKYSSGKSLFETKNNFSPKYTELVNWFVFNVYGDPSLKLNNSEIIVPKIKLENKYIYIYPEDFNFKKDKIIETNFQVSNYESINVYSENLNFIKDEDIVLNDLGDGNFKITAKINDFSEESGFLRINAVSADGVVRNKNFNIKQIIKKVYVSQNGNDENNGSKTFPFKTIQHAIDENKAESVKIFIEEGVYQENINIENTTAMQFSEHKNFFQLIGSNNVVIKGIPVNSLMFAKPPIYIKNAKVTIDNISITGGVNKKNGGGIYIENSQVSIINSKVYKNTLSNINLDGSGIYNKNSYLSIINSNIYENKGNCAIYNDLSLNITNSNIYGNYGGVMGGGLCLLHDFRNIIYQYPSTTMTHFILILLNNLKF